MIVMKKPDHHQRFYQHYRQHVISLRELQFYSEASALMSELISCYDFAQSADVIANNAFMPPGARSNVALRCIHFLAPDIVASRPL